MWACTVWRSHLFLDGRFTRGAASIWPAESDGGKRKTIVVICVACRRSSDKSFELNASSDQQSLIGEFSLTHLCSWWSCHRSPWRCARGGRCAWPRCSPRRRRASACAPTVTSEGPRTASGTRLEAGHTRNNKASEWDETTRHQNELLPHQILPQVEVSVPSCSPDLMLPSSRMTPPHRVYMDRLPVSLSLSPSLFSSSCFSLIFSQFLRRNTRCFSTKFLTIEREGRMMGRQHGRRYLDKDWRGGSFTGAFNNYGAYKRGNFC